MSLRDLLLQSKIEAEKEAKRKVLKDATIYVCIGAIIGTWAGILLAPKSGKETRDQLFKCTNEVVTTVKEKFEKTSETEA